jgi:hypothetical protein
MRSVFWKRYKRPHIYTMLRGKEKVIALEGIDRIPTAYDPDKVVKQLEDRSTLSRPVGWPKSYEIITLEDAIEIVRGGGKNE